MRSLWLKLLVALALAITVGTTANAWLIGRTTSGQFNRFVTASGQVWVEQTAILLANHYARTGSWDGAAGLLRAPLTAAQVSPSAGTPTTLAISMAAAAPAVPVTATALPTATSTPSPTLTPTPTPTSTPTPTPVPTVTLGFRRGAEGEAGQGPGMGFGRGMGTPNVVPPSMRAAEPTATVHGAGRGRGAPEASGPAAGDLPAAPPTPTPTSTPSRTPTSTPTTTPTPDLWGGMGLRLLLADADGSIVADTSNALVGSELTGSELAAGVPITVANRTVGTLLAVSALSSAPSPASDFVTAVNRSTWLATTITGALVLLLGLVLFRQIFSPVRELTIAARRIAGGDLGQRVQVSRQDEVGQLATSFNQMADALTRDRQLRRNMVADIAHELRTPIGVLQANLEAMVDGVIPTDAAEIASLHDETLLLARLVADLRLLSLAEAGQLQLEPALVTPEEIVRRAAEPLRAQADSRQISLRIDAETGSPSLYVDRDRVTQVLTNLLQNALRYTPGGGRIEVRASRHLREGGRTGVRFDVADSGPGIPEAELPHIFDRFYRADKSRNRASGGSGLGLAIARQLIEAHGGSIWAESRLGEGTTISFFLPAASPNIPPSG